MIIGINYIALRVRDLTASRRVYADILGLPELAAGVDSHGRPTVALRVGSSLLELHQDAAARPALDLATGRPLTSMYDDTCWVSHFAFPMVDAFARHRELAGRGIVWTCEPTDQPAGHHLIRRRLLEFTDPDYVTLQFAERIDEEGSPIPPAHADFRGQPWPGCDRFDHLMLNTPVMHAKRSFYMDVLGLGASPVKETGLGEQCDLTVGTSVIELTWQKTVKPPLHAGAISALGLSVANLDDVCARLQARDLMAPAPTIHSPVTGIRRRSMVLIDPDGLPIELVAVP
jgi:catechol 2,3-dioxygenase-like lactoylglutathione lyase family enzyme